MNKFAGILFGLVFLIVPIYACITNFVELGTAALIFLKGGVVFVTLFVGLVSLVVSLANLRE